MTLFHDIAYSVVALSVTILLLGALIFPFWKVWFLMKTRHTDLWELRGPFGWRDFLKNRATLKEFLTIIALADRDDILKERDASFVRWTQAAREIQKLMPVGLFAQLGYFFLFVCFVLLLTHNIMGVFS